MQSKFYLGLFVTAVIAIVASERMFNHLQGAQDLPVPEPVAQKQVPTAPPPSLPAVKEEAPVLPPPIAPTNEPQVETPKPAPMPLTPQKAEDVPQVIPPAPQKADFPPLSPVQQEKAKDAPLPPPPGDNVIPPPTKKPAPDFVPPPAVQDLKYIEPKEGPKAPPVPQVKLPSSPWSLHVEIVDGQSIVTATVNKKHAFRIVCENVNLQTGKGTLQAAGKVQISGDMMNGHCDELSIPLHDDRLVLSGGAEVRIQKVSTRVSDSSSTFELKGPTLDLRISDLQSGKLTPVGWQRTDDSPRLVQASMKTADKQWTPMGVLHRRESKLGPQYWLETRGGSNIDVAPREGGSLDEYVGRSISVFGMMEQIQGSMKMRVTHIALP